MEKIQYNFSKREKHWQEFWAKEKVYQFDPNSDKTLFTVDTPPPTVSGALHLGHVFSYTQAEVVVRYFRLAGFNVRYPLGFDNNGLPTERLTEKEKGVKGGDLSLEKFAKLCFEVIEKYTKKFENLFRILGFSFDWRLTYSTISPQVIKLAQEVFVKLYQKGLIFQSLAPALYCPECQTSVAQAEVEDKEIEGIFYDVVFKKPDGKPLIIATTRPELIPACVAVFVNPADTRYKNLVGKTIETPLGAKVKVFTDSKVQIEKGTGAVMCCTYGDETDVYWVKSQNLPEKIILEKTGKFGNVKSLPKLKGKTVEEARLLIVSELKRQGLIKKEEPILHSVGVHERCSTPIEIINRNQWFIKILDKKSTLIKAGEKVNWYPAFMKKRYIDWLGGLKWDWSISRERFFGVPIPVYHCSDCGEVILAKKEQLPADPRLEKFAPICPKCKSKEIEAEVKVLDTWFTSALTPEINNQNLANAKLKGGMYPMTMRPQAHDIIRTWALYTIAMGQFLHGQIPWKNLMISGHILAKPRQKISKKTGGASLIPEELIETHSADAVRYAMCSAKLGLDAYFDEGEIRQGRKLVTKILNVSKFTLTNLSDFKPNRQNNGKNFQAADLWILAKMAKTANKMASEFNNFEIGKARIAFEEFFWNDFCDNFVEIVKSRLYGKKGHKRQSAQYTLYQTLLSILKMVAPFVPHITEEIYQNYFRKFETEKSIHQTSWPKKEFEINQKIQDGAELMLEIISKVRKYKSDKKIGLGTEIIKLGIVTSGKKQELLIPFLGDLVGVTRAKEVIFENSKAVKSAPSAVFINL